MLKIFGVVTVAKVVSQDYFVVWPAYFGLITKPGAGSAAFSGCHNVGADKKTLHCVDKIRFPVVSTYLLSGGVWTSAGFGSIVARMREALRPRQKLDRITL
jgi:hypothetical protein